MVLVPLAMVGALGANWMAARELDEVSTLERSRRPLSDFMCGGLLGAILGLWTGVNHADTIRTAWSGFEKMASWMFPALSSLADGGGSQKRPPEGGHPGPIAQGGPPVVHAAPAFCQ